MARPLGSLIGNRSSARESNLDGNSHLQVTAWVDESARALGEF
jgi:hypothetical protein